MTTINIYSQASPNAALRLLGRVREQDGKLVADPSIKPLIDGLRLSESLTPSMQTNAILRRVSNAPYCWAELGDER